MIQDKIQKDQIQALKSRDTQKLEVLRYILAQLKYASIEKKQDLSDDDVIGVLRKQVKEIQESIEGFKKGGRTDLVADEEAKLAILKLYLPAEMSDDELKQQIQHIIENNKHVYEKNRKAVIGLCMKELKTKVDPSRITKMLHEEFEV